MSRILFIYPSNNPINTFATDQLQLDVLFVKKTCYKSAIIHAAESLTFLDSEVITQIERHSASKRLSNLGKYLRLNSVPTPKKKLSNHTEMDSFLDWTPQVYSLNE